MTATTIDEILSQLEELIRHCIKTNNRAGYFAALYYKVTSRVKEGILKGEFDDGKRMEALDVTFANRYLTAMNNWNNKKDTTASWQVAFDATNKSSIIVLQHLLLGINAHINFDLGIAAVEVARNQDIQNIRKDFNNINTIIASLTYEVLNEINRISPLLSLIGWHATNFESILVQFSISNARDGAWAFAEALSIEAGQTYEAAIKQRDADITVLAKAMVRPSPFIRITLWIIRLFEWRNPKRIIRALHEYKKKFIKVSG